MIPLYLISNNKTESSHLNQIILPINFTDDKKSIQGTDFLAALQDKNHITPNLAPIMIYQNQMYYIDKIRWFGRIGENFRI